MSSGDHTSDISLIIPAYNEERYLPKLLASVEAARAKYRGGRDAVEVIVSDNCSTDKTAEIAREADCVVARVEKRRIGAVRNGGAALARGKMLAFVDADLVIHLETFNAIDEVMRSGEYVAGATGYRLERKSLGLAATMAVVRTITTILRVDGGVVFYQAEAFRVRGGYSEDQDIAEDIECFHALRQEGRKRGLRAKLGTGTPAIVSTRKWDEHGDWHMFLMPLWPLTKRKSLRKIVDDYWYPEQR